MASASARLKAPCSKRPPATLALLVIPGAVVGGLFEHGAFSRADALATSAALAAFAGGLPAYVLVKILQPAFYAREDTVTPFRYSVASVVANIVLSLALFFWLDHVGIALATALAAWLNTGLLVWSLRHRGFWALDQRFRHRLPRILAASVLMGLVLWGLQAVLEAQLAETFFDRVVALALLVAAGLAAYGAAAFGLGAVSRRELLDALRRRPAEPGAESEH